MTIITWLTDFGTQDSYVAEMKGSFWRVFQHQAGPNASAPVLIDITHEVPPWDIERGAWLLGEAFPSFPPGTIHVGVVDPGVGSARKPIILQAQDHFFIGPDNGLFSRPALADPRHRIYEIPLVGSEVSDTFHGRDIFSPAAAEIAASGFQTSRYLPLKTMVILKELEPVFEAGIWRGRIVHEDRFGNLTTNLPGEIWLRIPGASLQVAAHELTLLVRTFSEAPAEQASLIINSNGYLEIISPNASAAAKLHAVPGTPVFIKEKQP
ncbi:MAG: SAM-dependent chlorinase/fluorinase [candidate division FCPU426 bacterium]